MKRQKSRKLPKRILAWIVCFSIAFSVLNVMPDGTVKVYAASADGAKIVAVAQSYIGKIQSVGRCLGFCRLVYQEAGYNTAQDPNGCGAACAYHSWTAGSHLGSTSKDNIPLGALVFFSGASSQSTLSCGARPGHVGIYVGDGYIINARGTVKNGTNISKDKISLWESWGYAFLGWRPISGYTLDSGGSAEQSFVSYMESPASGGNYSGSIGILGYALHKNGIRNVTAWVNGQVMDCPMYNSPDVAKVYPGYPTGNEGFQAQIPISCLKEGENEIDIYAYEKDDTPHLIASHKFNWNSFVGNLESPVENGSYDGTLSIQGYALHKNGIRNVTAWVNGQVMDCPMYNNPDAAKVYPGYPTGNEGFQAQIPISYLKEGENEIDIYAYEFNDWPHLIASHKFNWSSFVGKLESPIQNGSYDGTLSIQGYALHKNGIRNVTAWVNGQVMDCPMYERTEIATKYSGYPIGNEGFKTEIPISCLENGENEINVFAYESNDWPHNIASYKFNYDKKSAEPSEKPINTASPEPVITPSPKPTPGTETPDKSTAPSAGPSTVPQKDVVTETIHNDDGSLTIKVTEKETRADGSVSEKITETTTKKDGSVMEKIKETVTNADGSKETTSKEIITNPNGTVTEEEVSKLKDEIGNLTEIISQLKKIAENIYEHVTKIEKTLENGMLLQKEIKESSKVEEGSVVKETDVVDTKKDKQGKEVEKYEYSAKALPKEVEWIVTETEPLKYEQQTLDKNGAKEYTIYDIIPYMNGKKADMGEGSVKVRLYCGKSDWKNVKIFDIEKEKWLDGVYEDGYVSFEAEHFSKYAIAEVNTAKRGDIDLDGQVKLADAQLTLKAALNLMELDEAQIKAADVDGNGRIELKDAQMILKVALNLTVFDKTA